MYSSLRFARSIVLVLVAIFAFMIWHLFLNRLPNGYHFVKDHSDGWIADRDNWVVCGSRSYPEGAIKSYSVDRHFIFGVTTEDLFFVVDTRMGRVVVVRLDGTIVRTSEK